MSVCLASSSNASLSCETLRLPSSELRSCATSMASALASALFVSKRDCVSSDRKRSAARFSCSAVSYSGRSVGPYAKNTHRTCE
jgi:hypothetical protein